MDAEALRKTREHYNSHANLHEDREQVCAALEYDGYLHKASGSLHDRVSQTNATVQAMEARRQGKALPLKDFHNAIKRKMINRWVRAVSLY